MNAARRRFASSLLVSFAFLAGSFVIPGCRSKPPPQEIVVGAATSLRHVFPEITSAFEKDRGSKHVVVTYGASGDIARQVEAGAGVDVVVFAGKTPLDKLVQSNHVDPSTTKVIARNDLVLVGPEGGPKLTFETLVNLPPNEKVAIGDPKTVPVGQYAREAFERLSIWDKLEGRIVLGANVAAVLAYLQRGEVSAAVVYRTEMRDVKGIVVLDAAKGPWAPRPEIWAGVVKDSHDQAAAREFVEFLTSAASQSALNTFGFGAP